MVMTKTEALKILEIDSVANVDQIRASYKRLALKWHPDKHNNSAESTLKFQEISEAYKRLTDTDDDNVKISMGDMFDLFAHIFFTNGRYYSSTNDSFLYDDDFMYNGMNTSDSSDDELTGYRPRQRSKYCDLFASRCTISTKNIKRNANQNTGVQVSEAEAAKNAEELIKEEERTKKKAEKRRAKKKRNREKRKQREKEHKIGDDNSVGNNNVEDESNDEDEEQTKERENIEHKNENKKKYETTHGQRKKMQKKSEDDSDIEHEESSWDTSSAFFANAARRNPVNNQNENGNPAETGGNTTSAQNNDSSTQSRINGQNGDEELDPVVIQSRQLAVQGNNLANEGKYNKAIDYFTKAISLHECDFRFFGNRSYCFDRLGEYTKALQDAEVTISLAPVWPKGYFRKGRALAGLKQYGDAEAAFSHVLKLDKHCEDAKFELTRVRVQQLKDMGFPHAQSERAVRLFGTVTAALDALLSGKVKNLAANEEETYVSDEDDEGNEEQESRTRPEDMSSLWVGNVDPKEVTERQLTQLFSKCGPIKFIRILPSSFCAFVNYENKENAAKALQYLQGYSFGGQNLRIRYPNSDKYQRFDMASKPSGPVNGGECYFWRTTGCVFGDKCRYSHIPGHKATDLNKIEQKFGKIKPTKKGR